MQMAAGPTHQLMHNLENRMSACIGLRYMTQWRGSFFETLQ